MLPVFEKVTGVKWPFKMPERTPINKVALFGLRLEKLIASYSRGDSLDDLRSIIP